MRVDVAEKAKATVVPHSRITHLLMKIKTLLCRCAFAAQRGLADCKKRRQREHSGAFLTRSF
jgi:hypothetical protein